MPQFVTQVSELSPGLYIQFVSDVHLEMRTKEPTIHPKAKYLALLGDILFK
jgi:hypothetical protein